MVSSPLAVRQGSAQRRLLLPTKANILHVLPHAAVPLLQVLHQEGGRAATWWVQKRRQLRGASSRWGKGTDL